MSRLGFLVSLLAVHSAQLAAAVEPKPGDFATEIAPILERHCVRCHHPDDPRGDVSVSTRTDLIEGGYVVPGKAAESELLDLIRPGVNGKRPRMPKDGKPLTDAEIALLTRWIDAGAVWPTNMTVKPRAKAGRDWWSLRALSAAPPPSPTGLMAGWSKNPIDRFIAAKLSDNGLSPSSPADPKSLVRRLSYDLTGLPPSPEQIAEYVADPSDAAYERLVDRLLASPAYGERWGRHWLDVVRFGESNGFERNVIIDTAWPFRDYVIRSFNDDKPFDRLIQEQLAGDQLDPGNPEVEIGTTFLVCGPYDNVGNQDPAQAAIIRANTLDEIARAAGEAFLGLTIGCARCHDHKFDPITQADYYRLTASFAGVFHGERELASAAERQAHTARVAELTRQKTRLGMERSKLATSITERGRKQAPLLAKRWTRPAPNPAFTEETITRTEARYVRFTVLARDDRPELNTGFTIDEFEVWTGEKTPRNVALATSGATAVGVSRVAEDFADAYAAKQAIDGRTGGGWIAAGPTLTITLAKPAVVSRFVFSASRSTNPAARQFKKPFAGEYTIELSSDGTDWKLVASSADRQPASPAIRERRLFEAVITPAEQERLAELDRQLAKVNRSLAAIPALPRVWAGNFRATPGPFHIFTGGDPAKKAATVYPGSPSFLSEVFADYELTTGHDESNRRRALADWITHPANPLTPRVLANRIWQYHFGTGIVDTPSDFGSMGGKPTHPELLDWLARQLHAHDWRLKPIHRLIVTSQTYRQSSAYRPEMAAKDGDSRLLWRFPPRRLSAEEVRDSMLTVANKLDPKMGGPGFRLYRYLQDNVATYVPLDNPGVETFRRSVYHQNARAARVDVLTDFDCPDPAFATPRRASTTTPMQALTLFNHRFTVDMAKALAERVEQEAGDKLVEQVRRLFLLSYGRPPTGPEQAACAALVQQYGLAALCRAVLNSNEFLYLD